LPLPLDIQQDSAERTPAMEIQDPKEYLNKQLLIGLTILDGDENVLTQVQFAGRIIRVNEHEGIVVERARGQGDFTLPLEPAALKPAAPGKYRMRSSGRVVDNPDFLATWTVKLDASQTVDEVLERGFNRHPTH
jgi:hypothetical protein